jgi:glucose/arabinose dehydrogenase
MQTRQWSVFVLTAAAATVAFTALIAQAQQPAGNAKANASKAPKGINWPSPALPSSPITFDTGIERGLRLTILKGLVQPWSMAFLPDGRILITKISGRLRIVKDGVLDPTPVAGTPAVQAQGLVGLLDIALHPRFADNQLIYFTYGKPPALDAKGKATGNGILTLGRGRWTGSAITNWQDLFTGIPSGNASRMVFGRDGMVYMSLGSGDPPVGDRAQNPDDLAGKVVRLRDDGTVPPDNPFVNRPGYRPEIYTMGHRIPLGLTVNPVTGEIWECENGPNGGDEVNVLKAGKNYGWPVVSFGRFYGGPRVSVNPYREDMEPPAIFWVPSIATSGLAFYSGDRYPNWKNNLFIGGMRQGEVPNSGHFERVDFNDSWEELHREGILRDLHNRIRDIRQGPDGLLYFLTAENDGALLRIDPAAKQ